MNDQKETKRVGIGCSDGRLGPLEAGVWAMLAAGSPRLALARALGVPLAPYIVNVRATFPTVDTADVPDVGSDVKIVQDTMIDALVVRLQNDNTPQNTFSTLSDYYYNFQSGIEATLAVNGAPRYDVAENFTPLSTLADVINGNSHWPAGWLLTYNQQLFMSFHSRVTLPFAPYEVICTFRGLVPVNDMFMRNRLSDDRVFAMLSDCGIDCCDSYKKMTCR